MILNVSVDRFFHICMISLGMIAVYGAMTLPILDDYTLGPGGMPILFAIGLITCSFILLITSDDKSSIRWRSFIEAPGLRGFLFVLFLMALGGLVYIFGFMVSIFMFTFFGLIILEKWKIHTSFLFSVIWIAVIYVVFVMFLNIRFLEGPFI